MVVRMASEGEARGYASANCGGKHGTAVIRRMETFSVVQIPTTLSGRPWGIVRNDGHGSEAQQAAERLASQPPMNGKAD